MSKSEIIYTLIIACQNSLGHFTQFKSDCIKDPEKYFIRKGLIDKYNTLNGGEKNIFHSAEEFFKKLVEYGFKNENNVKRSITDQCKICNKKTEFLNFDAGFKVCCSDECSKKLRIQNSFERWDTKSPTQNESVKSRVLKSNIKTLNENREEIVKKRRLSYIKNSKIKHLDELYIDVIDVDSINVDFLIENFCDKETLQINKTALLEYFNIAASTLWYKILKRLKSEGYYCKRDRDGAKETLFIKDLENHLNTTLIKQYRIPGTRYLADGFDPETNTVYEFLGDFWHGNPKIYNPNDINAVNKKSFGILYENTLKRRNYLKSLDYKIKYIWESEYIIKGLDGLQDF